MSYELVMQRSGLPPAGSGLFGKRVQAPLGRATGSSPAFFGGSGWLQHTRKGPRARRAQALRHPLGAATNDRFASPIGHQFAQPVTPVGHQRPRHDDKVRVPRQTIGGSERPEREAEQQVPVVVGELELRLRLHTTLPPRRIAQAKQVTTSQQWIFVLSVDHQLCFESLVLVRGGGGGGGRRGGAGRGGRGRGGGGRF